MNENIEKRDRFFNILTFVLGITSAFSVRLIGVIYIAELICVVCFLFISKRKDCFPVQLRRMYIFLWIWIAGSVISNWYNQVPALDFLKGLFFKLFILVILPVLYWLLESHPERIFFWLFGTAFSSLLSLYVFPSVIVREFNIAGTHVAIYYWNSLALAVCALLYYYGRQICGCLLLLSWGICTLFFMSRNLFLIYFIAVFLVFVFTWYFSKATKVNFTHCFILFLILAGGLSGAKSTYEYLAEKEILGEAAYQKYMKQKYGSGEFGLASGRIDFFMALMALQENPIVGYGDYAKDYTDIRNRFALKYDLNEISSRTPETRMVPGHSHILGSWVYNGILALPFWLYCLYLIVHFLIYHLPKQRGLMLYAAASCMSCLFNLFFSPFGSRLSLISYVFFIVVMQKSEKGPCKVRSLST